MTDQQNDRGREESKRILDRVSREVDSSSLLMRASDRVRRHVTAKDGEAEDAIERWGMRIGRGLGLILVVAVVIWLVLFLIRGG
ncbi:hypothetical protein [Arvimicrobium flavum]|uniref:hypothetical protein n=1 Tax=Arvimicrobium flavum TaxID=3393320 RepID=UPI00237A91FA|nr:hypothetical protein [Mesorhizobium shangrilense]